MANKIAKLPSIKRLPSYLHILHDVKKEQQEVISTTHLASEMGLESIVVRKDLAITGILGKPGVGYKVDELISCIEDYLGWNNPNDAFLVGVGHLGTALLGYDGFANRGMKIVAAFDADEGKVGKTVNDIQIFSMEKMKDLVSRMHVQLGVLTVPAVAAQDAADAMVAAGIKGIWNFTPVKLKVPEGIVTQSEDLSSGLAVLSVKISRLNNPDKYKSDSGSDIEL